MEKFKFGLRSLSQESSSANDASFDASPRFSTDQSRILIRADPGRVVSLWTASKMCAVSFAVGIVVGFTLKRRLRRWASKLLKRLRDD